MAAGWVYILTNAIAPGVVKVGRTSDIARRLDQHNGASSTVGTWNQYWCVQVPDAESAEARALAALRSYKVRGRREQFKVDPKKAREIIGLELAEFDDWGARERQRLERAAAAELEWARRVVALHDQYETEFDQLNATWIDKCRDKLYPLTDNGLLYVIILIFVCIIGWKFGSGWAFIAFFGIPLALALGSGVLGTQSMLWKIKNGKQPSGLTSVDAEVLREARWVVARADPDR